MSLTLFYFYVLSVWRSNSDMGKYDGSLDASAGRAKATEVPHLWKHKWEGALSRASSV